MAKSQRTKFSENGAVHQDRRHLLRAPFGLLCEACTSVPEVATNGLVTCVRLDARHMCRTLQPDWELAQTYPASGVATCEQ